MPTNDTDTTPILNESDAPTGARNYGNVQLFRFSFGIYGGHDVYVWSRGMCDALEDAAEWLHDTAPGMFVTFTEEGYARTAEDIGAPDDWKDDDDWNSRVWEETEVDHTSTESGYLASWEWTACEVHGDEYDAVHLRSVRLALGDDGDTAPVWYARAVMADTPHGAYGVSPEDQGAPYTVSGWSGRIRPDGEPTIRKYPETGPGSEYPTWINRPRAARYLTDDGTDPGTIRGYLYPGATTEDGDAGPVWPVSELDAALEWVRTRPDCAVACGRINGEPLE